MLSVRPVGSSELATIAVDPLHATSQNVYAIERDATTVAYVGVNTVSLVATVGWPWLKMVRKDLLTNREVVRLGRAALVLWSLEYTELRVLSEEGVNKKWFEVLGFRLDTGVRFAYHDGKIMVQYRYGR